jgi:hypothetical protein
MPEKCILALEFRPGFIKIAQPMYLAFKEADKYVKTPYRWTAGQGL